MKIILVYPHCLEVRGHKIYSRDASVTPIGLYYIGAMLRENGHEVEIINRYDLKGDPLEIRDMLREKNPGVLGLSTVNANRFGGIETARAAREVLPGIKTVFGGIGATFLWRHLLKHHPEIDYVALGEGEHTFLELVTRLEKGDEPGLSGIRGLAYRQGGQILSTGPAEHIRDLDSLPSPSRYFTFEHLVSSRGCPANCAFCGSPAFWGRKVRFHSPRYFVDQLQQLREKGVSFFYISDDTFTLRKDRVIDICRDIIQRGLRITWFAISRVNCVDEEILLWMRWAGCIQISYGVESGSPRIRKALNKKIENNDIRKAFDLTVSHGILARAYFIYGSPGESRSTIRESISLLKEIKPLSAIFYILEIFPGTALYNDFRRMTGADDDIWLQRIEHINYFETDPGLSADMVIEFGRMLRTEYYRILPEFAASISLKDLPELYAGHADFLSRLGMTFSHGDYAGLEAIPKKEETAEHLYRRSLAYHPNERAYLGLGIIMQKQGRYEDSAGELSRGVVFFPGSEDLAACLCITYINLGWYGQALELTGRFPGSVRMNEYARACRQAMAGRT